MRKLLPLLFLASLLRAAPSSGIFPWAYTGTPAAGQSLTYNAAGFWTNTNPAVAWPSLTGIPSPTFNLTGDGSAAITLLASGVATGTFTLTSVTTAGSVGNSTAIPTISYDTKGRIIGTGTAVIIAPAGTLTGATLASNVLASSLTSVGTLTGGATGVGFTVALSSSTITGTLANARLTGSGVITIAGTSTALGGTITQDTITGLAANGLIKRTAANILGIATAGTDYLVSLAGTANQISITGTLGALTAALAGPHAYTTLTANAILAGNGTSPITATGASMNAAGTVFATAGGASWTDTSGAVTIAAAGTNQGINLNPSGTGGVLISNNTSTQLLSLTATGSTPFNLLLTRSDLTNANVRSYFDASGNFITRNASLTNMQWGINSGTADMTLTSLKNLLVGTNVDFGTGGGQVKVGGNKLAFGGGSSLADNGTGTLTVASSGASALNLATGATGNNAITFTAAGTGGWVFNGGTGIVAIPGGIVASNTLYNAATTLRGFLEIGEYGATGGVAYLDAGSIADTGAHTVGLQLRTLNAGSATNTMLVGSTVVSVQLSTHGTATTSGAFILNNKFSISGDDGAVYSSGSGNFGSTLTISAAGSAVPLLKLVDLTASGRTWFMGPDLGDGQVTHFNLYDSTGSAIVASFANSGTLTMPNGFVASGTADTTGSGSGSLQNAGGFYNAKTLWNAGGIKSIGGLFIGSGSASPSSANRGIQVYTALAGNAFEWGLELNTTTDASAISSIIGITVSNTLAAGSYTVANHTGIVINNPVIGAGAAITTNIGLSISNITGGGTNIALQTGTGLVKFGDVLVHKTYTVGGLPAAAAANSDGIVFVSDATQTAGTSVGSAPTGGGAVVRAVYSTGSAWLLLLNDQPNQYALAA